jgi:putative two-component system response regulator
VIRSQTLLDLSGDVIFEWDLVQGVLTCSGKWKERFGYDAVSVGFTPKLEIATHFHPDDLPMLREKIQDILNGETSSDVDVRIANNEGEYIWSTIRATTLFDKTGKPAVLIGIISDINDLKVAALSMEDQAKRDGLTKLFNKASAQVLISKYLSERRSDELSYMLILDLDNFKTVNDSYGHLYGDALLTQVGTTLRSLFRSQDILCRIGGDEFMIIVKDVPNKETITVRCDLLLNAFRELFSKMMPDLNVSCSIGIATIPEHGTTYSELFRHADQALYGAKRKGKNQYNIYSPDDQYDAVYGANSRTSKVESTEASGLDDNSFVRLVFHRLYSSHDLDTSINDLLSFIGSYFNVSRAYIFENNDDNTTCDNTFEWCNTGIVPMKDELQGLTYAEDLPGYRELFDENNVFYCSDMSQLSSPVRELLEAQDIKSILQCAIMDNGVFRGYVGFDECTSNRMWTQKQISILEFLSEVLAVFLTKQRTRQKVLEHINTLPKVS